MGISVIIAHYSESEVEYDATKLLSQTIKSLRNQRFSSKVEIIVCNDGSNWSKSLSDSQKTMVYGKNDIQKSHLLKKYDIDFFLIRYPTEKLGKAELIHEAIKLCQYEKVVILDDDHALISKKSLKRFDIYLNKFDYVRGRIVFINGKPTSFFSTEVQGTTYGFNKQLYFKFGGFPEFLFWDGMGDGNVMNWEVYKLSSNDHDIKACFAGDIITKNAASSRWKSMHVTPESYPVRKTNFTTNFIKYYNVNPWFNKGRKKYLWMQFASVNSIISEIYYLPKIFFYTSIRYFQSLNKYVRNMLYFTSRIKYYIIRPKQLVQRLGKNW